MEHHTFSTANPAERNIADLLKWQAAESMTHLSSVETEALETSSATESTDTLPAIQTTPTFALTPGRHLFKFECPLPGTLPPSYTTGFGSVRYWALANMQRPTGQNHEVESAIIIRPYDHLDLNDFPDASVRLRITIK